MLLTPVCNVSSIQHKFTWGLFTNDDTVSSAFDLQFRVMNHPPQGSLNQSETILFDNRLYNAESIECSILEIPLAVSITHCGICKTSFFWDFINLVLSREQTTVRIISCLATRF